MPRMQLPDKLLPFIETQKRFKVALGGRGGAKSMSFADMLIMRAQTEGARVGCFREFQNSIEDSVHSLLKREIQRLEVPGFKITAKTIDSASGGCFRFRGLARNVDSAKSMDGFNLFWVEEAQSMSAESLKTLTPTLREDNSEIWLSLNPMSSADPVSQRFIEPYKEALLRDGFYEDDLHYIVWINYDDNPWFPAVLDQEREHDFQTMPRAEYDHVWRGFYNDSVANAIIPAEWFDAAIDAHIKLGFEPLGAKIVSHDPSDEGADNKGLTLRHGSVVLDIQERDFGDVNEGCDWATDYAIEVGADDFIWDGDGMGISLKQQVARSLKGKRIEYSIFRGSERANNPGHIYEGHIQQETSSRTDKRKQKTNKETFKNKRAQYYWYLRDRFYNTYLAVEKGQYIDPDTMISLSSEISGLAQLKSEICRIPRKPNGNGMIQIMTKVEMARLKIESPNMADSLMMSLANDLPSTTDNFEMEFSGW